MSETVTNPAGDDTILPFQVGDSAVRGRLIRLGPAIDEILKPHPLPDAVLANLGEAVALVGMMGASLKFDGKLIMQAQGDGPVSLLVADYTASGALRGMAALRDDPPERATSFRDLLGAGHIAMTIDQGPDMDRYQGVTPIEGETIAEAAVAYFMQSEQIPTAIRLAVGRVRAPGGRDQWRAGGVMVQFMPGEGGARERGEAALKAPADEDLWNRAAMLLDTTQADELLDPTISAETLLYRLYNEDGVRVFEPSRVRAACSCNAGKIGAVLERYTAEDLADIAEEGVIRVNCEFCRREYLFDTNGRELRG